MLMTSSKIGFTTSFARSIHLDSSSTPHLEYEDHSFVKTILFFPRIIFNFFVSGLFSPLVFAYLNATSFLMAGNFSHANMHIPSHLMIIMLINMQHHRIVLSMS